MKRLFLVTEHFPYGTAEKSFILPELAELYKHYEVTIISHAPAAVVQEHTNRTLLPPEVKVINLDISLPWYRRVMYCIRFFFDQDGLKEILAIIKDKKSLLKRIYQSIGFYGMALENFRLMSNLDILPKDESFIYYTYWYFYYTYSMTRNRRKFSDAKIVTRAHRFDLYADAFKRKRQPFKRIMDRNIDKIFFIAEQGKKYYLDKYRLHDCEKYVVSRLGTIGTGQITFSDERKTGKFRLVSCSYVIPTKRVHLIVDALSGLPDEIEWVHFGNGSDFDKVKKQADGLLKNKQNITYIFKGFINNEEVLKYYGDHYVGCFISTSSSEGIPVSIQEAMSFGIPIIATTVGGVPELYEGNGVLLEANPSALEVRNAIEKIIHMDKPEYEKLRQNSYKVWSQRYNAEVNRVQFVEILEKLVQ